MACPALPTCGLAVTEAERALPDLLDQLETELARLGLEHERFTVRMTGCPNGCARPYNADIGLVGRSATSTPTAPRAPAPTPSSSAAGRPATGSTSSSRTTSPTTRSWPSWSPSSPDSRRRE